MVIGHSGFHISGGRWSLRLAQGPRLLSAVRFACHCSVSGMLSAWLLLSKKLTGDARMKEGYGSVVGVSYNTFTE